MTRLTPRLHRLPHRTDYTLIPAPLDLSLPEVAGKSELPAIIVTPSSPSSSHDFSLAFLPSPPKPSIRQRLQQSYKHFNAGSLRVRSVLFVLVAIFVMVCHLLTHRLAVRRPRLEFSVQTGDAHVVDAPLNWFDFKARIAGKTEAEAGDIVPQEWSAADYHHGFE